MENNEKILNILDEMVKTGKNLITCAEALKAALPTLEETATQPSVETKKEQPTFTMESVRELLIAKSNADHGAHRPAVKDLVRKYSASGQLSTVPPDDYPALMAELEVL